MEWGGSAWLGSKKRGGEGVLGKIDQKPLFQKKFYLTKGKYLYFVYFSICQLSILKTTLSSNFVFIGKCAECYGIGQVCRRVCLGKQALSRQQHFASTPPLPKADSCSSKHRQFRGAIVQAVRKYLCTTLPEISRVKWCKTHV